MVHIVGSISGPHHFARKIVVSDDFSEPSFQRGVQSFRFCFWCFGPKTGFSKKRWQKLLLCNFLFWWLYFMLLLDYKKGGGKNL